jgi:hypothetical protein
MKSRATQPKPITPHPTGLPALARTARLTIAPAD